MKLLPRRLVILCMLAFALLGSTIPVGNALAQSGGGEVRIWTYDEAGNPFTGACYVLLEYSNEGCDDNGDGAVTFKDVPAGDYTVRQTNDLGPGRQINDMTITVSNGGNDFYTYISEPVILNPDGTIDITVWNLAPEGGSYTGGFCLSLVGFSNVGCDEDGDGGVDFASVPLGTYTVRNEGALPDGWVIADQQITVVATHADYVVMVSTPPQTSSPAANTVDVSLITRDPETGKVITGACYQLLNYSNVGCDENSDGQVEFADIPDGTYTARQTTSPAGYPRMNDVEITIDGELARDLEINRIGIALVQRAEQSVDGSNTFAVVFYDQQNLGPVINESCAQLRDASNVGCDNDLVDGQVDFIDVTPEDVTVDTAGLIACPYDTGRVGADDLAWININDDISIIYVPVMPGAACS